MALKIGVLALCLLVIPIVTSWTSQRELDQEKDLDAFDYVRAPTQKRRCASLCKGTVHNRTIETSDGKVICLVPTLKELIDKLNEIGGYNRHYVAITIKEAEANFDNLLTPEKPKPTYPPYGGHTYRHRRPHLAHRHRGRGRKQGHRDDSVDPQKVRADEFKPRQKRTTLSCETPSCQKAGDSTKDGRLTCPACQRCTQLPGDVFPRYINEVTCDSSLSGFSTTHQCFPNIGRCKQKKMTIDLLTKEAEDYELVKSDGTTLIYKQVWKSKTQEIRSCCECFI